MHVHKDVDICIVRKVERERERETEITEAAKTPSPLRLPTASEAPRTPKVTRAPEARIAPKASEAFEHQRH